MRVPGKTWRGPTRPGVRRRGRRSVGLIVVCRADLRAHISVGTAQHEVVLRRRITVPSSATVPAGAATAVTVRVTNWRHG